MCGRCLNHGGIIWIDPIMNSVVECAVVVGVWLEEVGHFPECDMAGYIFLLDAMG